MNKVSRRHALSIFQRGADGIGQTAFDFPGVSHGCQLGRQLWWHAQQLITQQATRVEGAGFNLVQLDMLALDLVEVSLGQLRQVVLAVGTGFLEVRLLAGRADGGLRRSHVRRGFDQRG